MNRVKVSLCITLTLILYSLNPSYAAEDLNKVTIKQSLLLKMEDVGVPVRGARDDEFLRSLCALRELLTSKASRISIQDTDLKLIEIQNFTLDYPDGLNVSVTCQMAYFVKDNELLKVLPVSTGAKGYETKIGSHKTTWRVNGWRESSSYPGSYLYKPVYFYKGQAVHGMRSDSMVKNYPASHGCVRVLKKDAEYIFNNLKGKMRVNVFGRFQP